MNSYLNKKLSIVFTVSFILFILININLDFYTIGYDRERTIKIMDEFRKYNTLSYYDLAYQANPPLYYIIGGTVSKIIAPSEGLFQIIEVLYYFLGALIAYLIARNIGLNVKYSLLAFFIILTDPAFLLTHEIDFGGFNIVFSAIVIYFYIKFFRCPNIKNSVILGIVFGLSMLAKSMFLFMLIPLCLHFIVFALYRKKKNINPIMLVIIFSLIVYSPWAYYQVGNGFSIIPLPNMYHIQGQLYWDHLANFEFHFYGYLITLIKFSPIVFLVSLVIYFYCLLNKKIRTDNFIPSLFALLILSYPLLSGIVLKGGLDIINLFPVIVPSSLLLAYCLTKLNKKLVFLIIISLLLIRVYDYNNARQDMVFASKTFAKTCPYKSDFLNSLNENASVLESINYYKGNDRNWAMFKTGSVINNIRYKVYSDYLTLNDEIDLKRILAFNTNYLVFYNKSKPGFINEPFLSPYKTFNCNLLKNKNPTDIYLYKVDLDELAKYFNLTSKFKVQVLSNNMPVQAKIDVSGKNFQFQYKTKRNGEITVFIPTDGEYVLKIFRMGFKPLGIEVYIKNNEIRIYNEKSWQDQLNVSLEKGSSFFHGESMGNF